MKIFPEKLRASSLLILAGDVFLLFFSFFLAYLLLWGDFKPDFRSYFFQASVALLLCWLITAVVMKIYSHEQQGRSMGKYFLAILLYAVLLSIAVFLVKDFLISRILFVYGFLLFVFLDTLLWLSINFVLRQR